jgi:chromosome partitioning protein
MRVLAISNQKGGVAKTTTAISLSAALAERGRRVLAVDLDPQANLTVGLGSDPDALETTMFQVMTGAPIEAAIIATPLANLALAPADLSLAGAEKRLFGEIGFDEILRAKLRAVAERFDDVVIDCPPSLGLLTINAITAASTVIVPVQCEYFSARGLGQLLEITATVREKRNPALEIRVLPTLYDRRNRVCREILAELYAAFSAQIFSTVIGIDTRLREACAEGRPITVFAPDTRAAEEYRALAAEICGEPVGCAGAGAPAPAARARPAVHVRSIVAAEEAK